MCPQTRNINFIFETSTNENLDGRDSSTLLNQIIEELPIQSFRNSTRVGNVISNAIVHYGLKRIQHAIVILQIIRTRI